MIFNSYYPFGFLYKVQFYLKHLSTYSIKDSLSTPPFSVVMKERKLSNHDL